MAGGTRFRILAFEALRVEARSMGVETAAALGRVTGQTVPLCVTTHAGFQVLSCGLTVTKEKQVLGIVKPRAEPFLRGESGLFMTRRAEGRAAVAIVARVLPVVRGCRVTDQKSRGMVASG